MIDRNTASRIAAFTVTPFSAVALLALAFLGETQDVSLAPAAASSAPLEILETPTPAFAPVVEPVAVIANRNAATPMQPASPRSRPARGRTAPRQAPARTAESTPQRADATLEQEYRDQLILARLLVSRNRQGDHERALSIYLQISSLAPAEIAAEAVERRMELEEQIWRAG